MLLTKLLLGGKGEEKVSMRRGTEFSEKGHGGWCGGKRGRGNAKTILQRRKKKQEGKGGKKKKKRLGLFLREKMSDDCWG